MCTVTHSFDKKKKVDRDGQSIGKLGPYVKPWWSTAKVTDLDAGISLSQLLTKDWGLTPGPA